MYNLIYSKKKMQLTSISAVTSLSRTPKTSALSLTLPIKVFEQREKRHYRTASILGQAKSKKEKEIQIPISFAELKELHTQHSIWSKNKKQVNQESSSKKFANLKQKVLSCDS